MTVELHEDSVILRPQSDHDREALKRIAGRMVKVELLDDWDSDVKRGVMIGTPKDDWGT